MTVLKSKTVTRILDNKYNHNINCACCGCNQKFSVGEKVTRQQKRGENRYFCLECLEKL